MVSIMHDTDKPRESIRHLIPSVADLDVPALVDSLTQLTDAGPSGTMRAWFEHRDGRTVTTLQVTPTNVWAPTGRTIDASRASYVSLNGSRRDYAGMRVAASTDDGLIVTDGHSVIAYILDGDTA